MKFNFLNLLFPCIFYFFASLKNWDFPVYQCYNATLINIKISNFLMNPKNKKYMETKCQGNWISFQKNVVLTKYVHKYRQNLNSKDYKSLFWPSWQVNNFFDNSIFFRIIKRYQNDIWDNRTNFGQDFFIWSHCALELFKHLVLVPL